MSAPQLDSFQPILAQQIGSASITGTFQPISVGGLSDNCKILKIYNGSAVAIDVSYDGLNLHDVWPAGMTLIVDLQAGHGDNPPYGSGTLNARLGQLIWVRTSVSPTALTISGYR